MVVDAKIEYQRLQHELQGLANPLRAVGEKKYLKSDLNFYGVDTPNKRKIAKNWIKNHSGVDIDGIIPLVKQLWASTWFEERSVAIELLSVFKTQLNREHVPLIETMIYHTNTWAELDAIACDLIGQLLVNDNTTVGLLSKWIVADNFWVRRAAILAQNKHFRNGKGDFELFETLVTPQFNEGINWSGEERFFIRKAIGWALRELAPGKPQLVFDFVVRYHNQMSGLTYREATRKLPENYKNKLLKLKT